MRTHRPHPALPALRPGLAGLTLALVLTACSSTEAPAPPPYEPTTAVSTPRTPDRSSPGSDATPAGETPAQFLQRWAEASDRVQLTGNPTEFNALWRGCFSCTKFIENVEEIYEAGGRIELAATRVINVVEVGTTGRSVTLDATVVTPRTRIVRGDGRIDEIPRGMQPTRFYLQMVRGTWVMTAFSGRSA